MQKLNFPTCQLQYKSKENKTYVWDIIRKKYILLTPEEYVRQHMIHYLINYKNYSKNLISVEKQLNLNGRKKRFDLVVFNQKMQPEILVECKAPDVIIDQKTFDQANRYNIILKAPYLILTNGRKHYICKINFEENSFEFLQEIPKKN